jgi:hypothetical protein
MRTLSWVAGAIVVVSAAQAQPAIHLKTWKRDAARTESSSIPKTKTPGRSHLLVQFATNPGAEQVTALAERGVDALSYVPDYAISVAARDGVNLAGLGIQWIGRLQPAEKISPAFEGAIASSTPIQVVAEFYTDVPSAEARAIANDTGLVIQDNPDLLPNHLLLSGTGNQLMELSQWDEVSYIFPASQDLVQGNPVHGCAGALTAAGPVGQAVPLVGDGWDGPGLGTASLSYAFVNITQQVPVDSAESEIERAYAEWAKVVQVTFTETSDSTGSQTLAVLFASGAHGDGYPFTSGVLAHTFYPVPVNAEPIAGDQHFNNDESWKIGADVDVFSVALHETGHALGLGHSDNPADVMYPYYHIVTGLSPGDIAAVQQLYAANNSTNPAAPAQPAPTPAPAPLVLTIQPPVFTTSSSSIALSGTASGGSGAIQISWSTNQGVAGTGQGSSNWSVASIPLSVGANVITVTAADAKGDHATQSVTVTEQTPSPPADNPTPGAGTDTTPPSITILSPAMTTVSTSASSIMVSGTASDNVGVAIVTWSSSTGGSGTANGMSNWTTGAIPLYVGMTTIIINASDAAGNTAWRSITVTRY